MGLDWIEGIHNWGATINQNRQYLFFNKSPISITQIAGPFHEQIRPHKRSLFVWISGH